MNDSKLLRLTEEQKYKLKRLKEMDEIRNGIQKGNAEDLKESDSGCVEVKEKKEKTSFDEESLLFRRELEKKSSSFERERNDMRREELSLRKRSHDSTKKLSLARQLRMTLTGGRHWTTLIPTRSMSFSQFLLFFFCWFILVFLIGTCTIIGGAMLGYIFNK